MTSLWIEVAETDTESPSTEHVYVVVMWSFSDSLGAFPLCLNTRGLRTKQPSQPVAFKMSDSQLCPKRDWDLQNDWNYIMYSSVSSIMSHWYNNNNLYTSITSTVWECHLFWYLIIRAVWSFLLPRLRPSDRDVPPTEKLHSEPWRWLLLRLCGCSWNWPCVSNGMMIKGPVESHSIQLCCVVLHSNCSL